MPRPLNEREIQIWNLYCLWREYCPKFKPFTREENDVHPGLKSMVCADEKCKIREKGFSETNAERMKKQKEK